MTPSDENMTIKIQVNDQASAKIRAIKRELESAVQPKHVISITAALLLAFQGFVWIAIGIAIGLQW